MEGFSGDRVREARLALGMSQKAFANAMRIGERTLRRIETGEATFDGNEFPRLSELTGKPMRWFFADHKGESK